MRRARRAQKTVRVRDSMDRQPEKRPPEQDRFIEKLFQEEYEDMAEFARHVLGDGNLADVAVQETFLIALRKADELMKSRNPTGWLYNTLRNILMHLERERNCLMKRNVSLYAVRPEAVSCRDSYSEVGAEVQRSEDWKLLTAFYLGGRSIKELAREQGVSEAVCKSRLKRARERLRRELG